MISLDEVLPVFWDMFCLIGFTCLVLAIAATIGDWLAKRK